jgi:hypothetical protein
MTVVAHAGHLLVDIPLFMGPVVVLVVALVWSARRERRRERERAGAPGDASPNGAASAH